jgi:hypothetical protein
MRYTPTLSNYREVKRLHAAPAACALHCFASMKLTLFCLGASACATVSPIHDVPSHASSHYLTHLDAPARSLLVRRGDPELPSAVALSEWWRARGELTAHVQLCVAPTGETVHVHLAVGSGERKYDEAVLTDAARWTYEPFTAKSSSPVCEPANVTFLP